MKSPWLLIALLLVLAPTGSHGRDRFSCGLKAFALLEATRPARSVQNPDNTLARIPERQAILILKPHFGLTDHNWRLSAKPRLKYRLYRTDMDTGTESGRDQNADIPEFLIRRKLADPLFLSYGRENLQWGPAFLYSPSNPFFSDNEKKSLVSDSEGKGFLKLSWVQGTAFSSALIWNTDKGSAREPDFHQNLALKTDYSGDTGYASLILSHGNRHGTSLGAFAGLTLTDAVILYGEASVRQGSRALYPQALHPPLSWDMAALKKNRSGLCPVFLAGAAWTGASGGTLTLEYLYYGPGYDSGEMADLNRLWSHAGDLLQSGSPLSGYGRQLLGASAGSGLDFQRRHYLMAQYIRDDLPGKMDMITRLTVCVDDGSAQAYSSLARELNSRLEMKISGLIHAGGSRKAFGPWLDHQIQLALEYTY